MRAFFGFCLIYGLVWSGIQASWTMIEYKATIEAFNARNDVAELRHRINGQSGQICFFLANLIAVGSAVGYTLTSRTQSTEQQQSEPPASSSRISSHL
jgi:hypothetical protein